MDQVSPQARALRDVLKDATAADHMRLDARLGAFDLQTLAGYRRFLEANAAALLPLERALVAAGVGEMLPDWGRRERSGAIQHDIEAVGGTVRLLDAPAVRGLPAVLGTLYVLEGSRLGAAYLLREVRRASDARILGATAYLAHGAGNRLWPTFLGMLESHADDLEDKTELVQSARRAFALFLTAAQQ